MEHLNEEGRGVVESFRPLNTLESLITKMHTDC
jgi:hypothetical protein